MYFSKYIILIWIMILPLYNLNAQKYIIDIQNITPKDGLANLFTSAMYQGDDGFMWIGTNYGLNRYDGYHFKLFTKEKNGLHRNSNIHQIANGGQNKLWVFYQDNRAIDKFFRRKINHIDVFDTKTNQTQSFETYFRNRLPFQVQDVVCLKINDAKNRSWIVTNKGELFLLKNKQFIKIFQTRNKSITAVSIDKNDNLFIGVENDLVQTNLSNKQTIRTTFKHTITDISIERNVILWVTIKDFSDEENQEITIFSKKYQEKVTHEFYRIDVKKREKIEDTNIRAYRIGEIWFILEDEKVCLLDEQKNIIKDLSNIIDATTYIDQLNIWIHENVLWLGTSSGIVKIHIRKNYIKIIHQRERLSDCRGITEDEQGNIYFNNSQGYQYNPKLRTLEIFRAINGSAFTYFYDDKIFSGIYSNEYLITISDLVNKQTYLVPKNDIYSNSMIAVNNSKDFLIGTDKGLLLFNPKTYDSQEFTKYNQFNILKTTKVNAIKQYGKNIWLATNNGIFQMTEKDGILAHFSQASDDFPFDYIQHLHIDKQGVFWLATKGAGLIRWQPNKKDKTKQFTTNDGLSHNYLYSVYEDAYNNLWMSSDNGIMRMDKETEQVQIFTMDDGLLHDEFNSTSHYQAKNRTLYFGGLGGLVAIQPKDFINQTQNKTPLTFTDLLVLEDDKEEFTDKTDLLYELKKLILKPSDKLVEIRFSLLNFANKENQTYAYKIEGYTNRWQYSNENFIRITNLPYGTYTLKIKGKTGSQSWSTSELQLTIKVLKPFYLQGWFICLCIFVISGIAWFYYEKSIQRLEKDKATLAFEVKKRTSKIEADKLIIEQQSQDLKALDIAKTKFFSNITHEFRTPLTLIAGPTQLLAKQDLPKPVQEYLNIIDKNAKHLLDLVNQLLDLSKLEVGKMPVELVNYDIIEFTNQLIEQLKPLADNKNLTIDFQTNAKEWTTIFDKDKWHKIVFNLLSNALKFTPKNGKISIELSERIINNEPNIYFKIADNGIGIPIEAQTHIFNRFHQVDGSDTRLQAGTGIGLALVKELIVLQNGKITVDSKVGVGTSFSLHIPIEIKEISGQQIDKTTIFPTNISTSITSELLPKLNVKERLRLLIIEDNEDIRTYIKSCIDTKTFEIIEAENGQIGIKKAIEVVPDLIISDVMMPQKNGFEVTKAMRKNAVTSHIPIILLTAKTALESRLEGIKRGADVYLTKPFSADELVLRIYKLIELRQLLQQRYSTTNGTTKKVETSENTSFEIEDKFIKSFRTYVLENLDKGNLEIGVLAQTFQMSRMQLHRKIKALTNKSTSKYVQSLRVEKAHDLLQRKQLSIAEVAYRTGFSSPSHFTQVFKKHYNKRPSEV